MAEEIDLRFKADEASFDELDRRLAALADKAAQRFGRALSGGNGGPGGAGSVGSGEGTPKSAPIPSGIPSLAGQAAQVALAGLQGAGAAVQGLAPSALGTGYEGTAAGLGAAKGLLGATLGQVPLAGDLLMARFNAYERSIRDPIERAASETGAIAEQYGRTGTPLSGRTLDEIARVRLFVAARDRENRQAGERAVYNVAGGGSLMDGMAQLMGITRQG